MPETNSTHLDCVPLPVTGAPAFVGGVPVVRVGGIRIEPVPTCLPICLSVNPPTVGRHQVVLLTFDRNRSRTSRARKSGRCKKKQNESGSQSPH